VPPTYRVVASGQRWRLLVDCADIVRTFDSRARAVHAAIEDARLSQGRVLVQDAPGGPLRELQDASRPVGE
jgi:hypothetical protein